MVSKHFVCAESREKAIEVLKGELINTENLSKQELIWANETNKTITRMIQHDRYSLVEIDPGIIVWTEVPKM